MQVKDDNKTVPTAYPEKNGEVLLKSQILGNLQVRFCEGA